MKLNRVLNLLHPHQPVGERDVCVNWLIHRHRKSLTINFGFNVQHLVLGVGEGSEVDECVVGNVYVGNGGFSHGSRECGNSCCGIG